MNEIIALIAVIAAITGAVLSTIKGQSGSGQPYNVKKLLSSLIISVMTVIATINFGVITDQLSTLGYVGLIITYMVLGFGTDQGLSKLDK